jgi:hypothetical protein
MDDEQILGWKHFAFDAFVMHDNCIESNELPGCLLNYDFTRLYKGMKKHDRCWHKSCISCILCPVVTIQVVIVDRFLLYRNDLHRLT